MPTDGVPAQAPARHHRQRAQHGSGAGKPAHVRAFQDKLADAAEEAEQATGVPAKFMLGQAALETGWGKRVIRNADGSSSNNLFGIKAGPGWKGKVATAVTTEYVNGKPHARVEKLPRLRLARRRLQGLRQHAEQRTRATRKCWPTAATPPASRTACSAPATPPIRSTRPSWRSIIKTLAGLKCFARICRQRQSRQKDTTMSLLSIGKTGLFAAQAALATTGNNITNANVARLQPPGGGAGDVDLDGGQQRLHRHRHRRSPRSSAIRTNS